MRVQPLPRDVLTVIRLASGSRDATSAASTSSARNPTFVRAAAEHYLRQVVCFRGASPNRTLGVPARATRAEMRQHMRELVLWLHPDRNPTGGDAILMQRVLEAWHACGGSGDDDIEARPARARRAAPMSVKPQRASTYRPSWVSDPLPKTKFFSAVRRPLRIVLLLTGVSIGLAIPDFGRIFDVTNGLWRSVVGALASQDGPPSAAPQDLGSTSE